MPSERSRPLPKGDGAIDLSVVIPCHNAEETLGEQLDALAAEAWTRPWEVIVADNGSSDGSREVARRYRERLPGLRIVDASERLGAAHAQNVAAEVARGESLAFCDADDVIAPGWVAAIGEALSKHELVASRHDVERLNPRWLIKGRGSTQLASLQRTWYPPYLPHAGSCGLGVRRSLLLEVGGFDEAMSNLYDTDMCLRLQRRGVALHLVRDAVIHIRYRETWRAAMRQAYRWAWFNCLLYKRHRADQRLPNPWRSYANAWLQAIQLLRRLGSRTARMRLAWQIGWQVGLLGGSLSHRVSPVAYRPERAL